MKHVLILEDHSLIQTWVSNLISSIFPEARQTLAATVTDCQQHLGQEIDLIMVDLNLPDGQGQDIIAQVKKDSPQTRCVVMTSFDDDQHLFSSLKAGADGYLLKDQPETELKTLLQGILEDKPPLSPTVAHKMMQYFHQSSHQQPALDDLTPRENETLKLISRGFSAKEVAREMAISPNTVSGYIKEVYRKLNIHSRAEAATLSLKLGL